MSDKTEEPTPKRLRKAQEEGNSPLSTFASQAIAFLCAVAIAPAAVLALAARTTDDLHAAIARAGEATPPVGVDPTYLAGGVLALSAPILAAAAVSGAVTSVIQTGGVIATKKLAPSLAKLDPIAGFKNLFTLQRLVAVARAALFAGVVAYFTVSALRENAAGFARAAGRVDAAILVAATLALGVAKRSAMVGVGLAVLDVVLTRHTWRSKLKMTKEEVKREHKESEGDPQQKAARERAHHEVLAGNAIASVRNASVVVVNPTHIACALKYDESEGDEAPMLLASGHGDLARKIVEAAHAYGVPVLRDVPLARALVALEVGDEIPEALYEAVAEILKLAWEEPPGGS